MKACEPAEDWGFVAASCAQRRTAGDHPRALGCLPDAKRLAQHEWSPAYGRCQGGHRSRAQPRPARARIRAPEHENGAPNDNFEVLDIWMAVWCAGAAHAGGGDWRGVLRQIRNPAAAQDAQELEAGLIEGFCIGEACAVSELGTRLDELEAAVDDIFGELETHSGVSGLLLQARRTIARQLALVLPVGRCFLGVEIRSPFQLKSRADAAACDVWTVMRTPRGAKVLSENAPWTAQGSFAGFFGGASWLRKKSAVLTRNRLRRGLIANARDRVGVRGKFARKALEYVQRLGWASEKVPLKGGFRRFAGISSRLGGFLRSRMPTTQTVPGSGFR